MAGDIKGITIQLGADTTKLSSALRQADKSIKQTQTQLSAVEKALKFDPGNTDLLRDKFRLMGERIKETKDRLETLQEAQRQLDAKGVDKNSEEYQALQVEIDTTKSKLKGLEDQAKEFGSVGAEKARQFGDALKEAGEKISKTGETLTKSVTTPIMAIGAASVKAWNEVDDAMDTVIKKTGATGKELDDLENSVTNIAESIPVSFSEAGTAIGEVNTRFELTGDELEDLSTRFIKFAKLNGTDVNKSIDSVQQAMSAFGLEADQAGAMLDTMNRVGQETGISMDTLSSLMVTNATAFQSLGMDAADAAHLLGTLEKSGVDTSVAMTGLSKVQKKAMQDGVSMEKALKDALTSSEKAIEIFGAKAGPKLYQSFENGTISVEDFVNSTYDLDDALGSVSDTYEATLDPMDQMQTTMNALKSAGAEIVNSAAPMITEALTAATEVIKKLSDGWKGLSAEQKQQIIKIAGIVAAVGPLLVVIGKVVTVIGTLMPLIHSVGAAIGVLAGVFSGPIVIAIGAAVGAFVLLLKYHKQLEDGTMKLVEGIKQKWSDFKTNTAQTWQNVKDSISTRMDEAKTAAQTKLANMKTNFQNGMNDVKTNVSNSLENVKAFFQTKLSDSANTAQTKLAEIKANFQNRMSDAKNEVSNRLGDIQGFFTSKLGSIASTVDSKMTDIKNSFINKLNEAKNTISGIIDTIKGLFNFSLKLDIKLPHISVSGGVAPYGIGGLGKLPSFSVSWYDQGGIFDRPSIIGVGEKRPEFVGALDDLREIVRQESGSSTTNQLLAEMLVLMAKMADNGGKQIAVYQTITTPQTSYSEQQKAAAYEFKQIARALG